MNFKQALIAHLQGERVEVYTQFQAYDKPQDGPHRWRDFGVFYESFELGDTEDYAEDSGDEYRLSPRTIICNGVEVVAGESREPEFGNYYYLPSPSKENRYASEIWNDVEFDLRVLSEGLVYLNKEDAIARAKAMLIVQEVK